MLQYFLSQLEPSINGNNVSVALVKLYLYSYHHILQNLGIGHRSSSQLKYVMIFH